MTLKTIPESPLPFNSTLLSCATFTGYISIKAFDACTATERNGAGDSSVPLRSVYFAAVVFLLDELLGRLFHN